MYLQNAPARSLGRASVQKSAIKVPRIHLLGQRRAAAVVDLEHRVAAAGQTGHVRRKEWGAQGSTQRRELRGVLERRLDVIVRRVRDQVPVPEHESVFIGDSAALLGPAGKLRELEIALDHEAALEAIAAKLE